jgi:hypothetical protein
MKRREPELEPELEAFLRPRKIVRSVPAEIRARALNRAKRIIATGGATPPASGSARAALQWRAVTRGRPLPRLALIVSVALVAGTVGAVVAVHHRSARIAPPPASELVRPGPGRSEASAEGEPHEAQPVARKRASVSHVRRASADGDSVAVELALLQRAQTAYARHDCSRALMLLADHGRRFPESRLAEERDALRVRSLGCAGHRQEAQRAAAEFAVRFPRSVLLPRVGEWEGAPE